jgi:hypothetical protein
MDIESTPAKMNRTVKAIKASSSGALHDSLFYAGIILAVHSIVTYSHLPDGESGKS